MRKLYNKAVYMPKLKLASQLKLRYSNHAQLAALNDRYGNIDLPSYIDSRYIEVVEIEVVDGALNKIVFRTKYTSCLDLVIVMNVDGFVRTVWLQRFDDVHKSLDRSKFAVK